MDSETFLILGETIGLAMIILGIEKVFRQFTHKKGTNGTCKHLDVDSELCIDATNNKKFYTNTCKACGEKTIFYPLRNKIQQKVYS